MAFGRKCRWNERPSSGAAGVYAYFVTRPEELASLLVPDSGIIYVGMTADSLDARCHFEHRHSGFSTLRRSLGAILKERLHLTALARSAGASPSNSRNYRFCDAGEDRLTAWMREHLLYAHQPIAGDVDAAEREQIRRLCPPLNLDKWPNPQRAEIKRLRARCVAEARRQGPSGEGPAGG